MRITSKILSVILVLCMMLTTVSFAAAYTDVSVDDANYPAVSLLSSLGIIKGYEDGTFGPEKNVTRAEFTVMLIRTLNMSGIGSSDPAGLPFEDVASVDWAVSDIRTAYDLGIINGMSATEFAPNDQVTSEQALKMIVCAMGYEPMAIEMAGGADKVWPVGYTTVAGQLNLTAGVTSAMNTPAKRIEIAKYIYNALEVDLMQSTEYANGAVKTEIKKGVNILNDKLKVLYGTGELRADNESSAEESGTLSRPGEVLIYQNDEATNDTFAVNDISTKGLVGRSIKYYYKQNINGEKTLLHIIDATKSSSVLAIDLEMFEDVIGDWDSGVEISYWESDDARNVTDVELASNPIVSVNGRVIDTSKPENAAEIILNIDAGSIELVDSNNGGYYNKVNVISYQTYVVGSVSTAMKQVTDWYNKQTVLLDEDDVQTTIKMTRASNGSSASLSSLTKYNVISVKESNGANSKKVIEVIISNEKVSGTINAIDIDAKEMEINSKAYKISNYILKNAANEIAQLEINDTCDFYLDKDGKIAAFEKTEATNTSYAYICGVAYDDAADVTSFRIIDQSGAKIAIDAASRVKIDGDNKSTANIEDYLLGTSDNADGKEKNGSQLVKITKNSSGKISAIDTIKPSETNESETNLKQLSTTTAEFTYKLSNKEFTNGSESFMIDSSTVIFAVPAERTEYTKYQKNSMSYFKDKRTYVVEVFDKGDGRADKAKCVVVYGEGGAETLIAESPIMLLSSRHATTNSEGEQVHRLSCYAFGDGEQNSASAQDKLSTDSSKFSSVNTGDVFRIAYTNGSEVNENSQRIIAMGPNMGNAFYTAYDGDATADYVAAYGLLVGASGDSFVLANTNDIDDLINGENVDMNTFTIDSDTVFAVYNANENDANLLKLTNDNLLMSMPTFDDTKHTITYDDEENIVNKDNVESSEIFTYVVDDRVLLVYQIIR